MGSTSLFRVGDDVELWRVLLHLSVLVVCLLLFERALHHLEQRASVSVKYQKLLSKAYRELMILGLLGLGLKLVKEVPSIDGGSAAMTAFQIADLTIFILALALILQTVCIFLILQKHNSLADRAELIHIEDLADAAASPNFDRARDTHELVRLRLLRYLFLSRFKLPQLFPFAKYLRQAQNNQIVHMTDVNAPMWVLLLAVAWMLEGITAALDFGEPELSKPHGLVVVLIGFSWILFGLHILVFAYFRSCVYQILRAAGMSADQHTLENHLRSITYQEARAWTQEDAGKALLVMQKVQEEYESARPVKHGCMYSKSMKHTMAPATAPAIEIRWFSRESWHFMVMMLLMLNGFYLALVVQCVAYQFGESNVDWRLLEMIVIPLPLALNTFLLQPQIFRNFVLVSSIFRVDGITLSEVVNHFREIIELRSEFAALVWEKMQAKKLSIGDLQVELESHDPGRTGTIDVDMVRVVLRGFGLHLSKFRFNSVAKLLFELKEMQIEYLQLLKLVAIAQREELNKREYAERSMHHHPLLLQSVLSEDVEDGFISACDASYLPPSLVATSALLTSRDTTSSNCVGENIAVIERIVCSEVSLVPARSQLNRNDKFQRMSSRTLSDLFHIESVHDVTQTSDKPFTNVL